MTFLIFLNTEFHAGGMYQYTRCVIDLLREDKHRVVIISSNKALCSEFKEHVDDVFTMQAKPFSAYAVWLLLPLARYKIVRKLARWWIGLDNWVCKYSSDEYAWLFPAQDIELAYVDARTIGTVHDLMHKFYDFPEVSGFLRTLGRNLRYRSICKYSDFLLVDSELGSRHVTDFYGRDRDIFPLHYMAPSYITYLVDTPDVDRMGLDNYIFYPGQFWEHKNHERLILAFSKVRNAHEDLCLVLTGSHAHSRFARLKGLAEDLGVADFVKFLGRCEEPLLNELVNGSQGVIMPSFFGPTNIPPIEAASVGVPIAVADLFECTNIPGTIPILFDPTSVDSIADAINALLCQSKKDVRSAGAQRCAIEQRVNQDLKFLINNLRL